MTSTATTITSAAHAPLSGGLTAEAATGAPIRMATASCWWLANAACVPSAPWDG